MTRLLLDSQETHGSKSGLATFEPTSPIPSGSDADKGDYFLRC